MRGPVKGPWIWLVFAALWTAGCGSSRPAMEPLERAYLEHGRDLEAMRVAGDAAELQRAAESKRSDAIALAGRGKDAAAYAVLERAVADLRSAGAATEAAAAASDADVCRQTVERARQSWDQAIRTLQQTERIAGRNSSAVSREEPTWPAGGADLPDSPGLRVNLGAASSDSLRRSAQAWRETAVAKGVPVGDLAADIDTWLALAEAPKTKPDVKSHALYLTARRLEEMEARVRRDADQHVCLDAVKLQGDYGDQRDRALRATLELERNLKDSLRDELDRAVAEAKSRQTDLYDALHQLEGKFAKVRQDARGTIVSLADILFDFDKSTLRREVEFNLVKIATILNQFPEMKILVEGHTDNVGKPEYNLDLSKRRAQSVRDFLNSQEVAAERLSVAGYGSTQPVADNATDEGRQKNRRVDLVIQEQP